MPLPLLYPRNQMDPASLFRHRSVLIALLMSIAAYPCRGGPVVMNQAIRLRVMHLAFPNAEMISAVPAEPEETPHRLTDPVGRVIDMPKNALAGKTEYKVIGPDSQVEELPASDLTDGNSVSHTRRVQIQVYE